MFLMRVYHCPCVDFEIKLCLVNGLFRLKDIISELKQSNLNCKIYGSKCRNKKDIVFSCQRHMVLKTVCKSGNTRCLRCIKAYLQKSYYLYKYTNFDLAIPINPLSILFFNR